MGLFCSAVTNAGGGVDRSDTVDLTPPLPAGPPQWYVGATGIVTMGVWSMMSHGNGGTMFAFKNGVPNNFTLGATVAGWSFNGNDSVNGFNVTTGTYTIGVWNFALIRYLGANLQYLDVLQGTGPINHASQSSAGVTGFSAPTTLTFGSAGTPAGGPTTTNLWIADWWYADADVVVNTATAISDSLLWKLAFEGPFSVPRIVPSIVYYHSFRTNPFVRQGPKDSYTRPGITPLAFQQGGTAASAARAGQDAGPNTLYQTPRQNRGFQPI